MIESIDSPRRVPAFAAHAWRGFRVRGWLVLCLALFAGVINTAFGQWPERPLTLVVMYSPGGGTDTMLRALAAEMASATGWRINVVNRPGRRGRWRRGMC